MMGRLCRLGRKNAADDTGQVVGRDTTQYSLITTTGACIVVGFVVDLNLHLAEGIKISKSREKLG